jgi:hypothetical protein
MMTKHEEEYRELRQLSKDERRSWLRRHAPSVQRGHWWLSLIERAEFDASPLRELPDDRARENIEFAVDLINMAVGDGMPRYYAGSRLCLITTSIAGFGQKNFRFPNVVTPDGCARFLLECIRPTREQIMTAAARLSDLGYDSDEVDSEFEMLRELNWTLADLKMLYEYLTDKRLALEVKSWLDISEQLSG